jgi:hypothetical protein
MAEIGATQRERKTPAVPGTWEQPYLVALTRCPVYGDAAESAGISESTARTKRAEDPEFKSLCEEARDAGIASYEATLFRRCMFGVVRPIFYQGEQCGEVPEFPEHLALAMLRRFRPEYREHTVQDSDQNVVIRRSTIGEKNDADSDSNPS